MAGFTLMWVPFFQNPEVPRPRGAWGVRGVFLAVLSLAPFVACGQEGGADPFGPSAGRAGAGGAGGQAGEGPEIPDGGLGEACLDDAQCDDGFDCTSDSCDLDFGRCRNAPSDAACDDGVYCNGAETCSPTLGCRAGPVVTCSDNDNCSIDTCVEETRSCAHEERDADGDGDPTASCGGGDCDDLDPLISGTTSERCDNARDDDCDGETDESDCAAPEHDRCGTAFEIDEPGTYALTTVGAALDYAPSCTDDSDVKGFRDVVLAIEVPAGEARDVSVVATSDSAKVILAAAERCGRADTEIACERGSRFGSRGEVARLLLHGLAPGAHAVYLATSTEATVLVRVEFRDASSPPEHETCGTAAPIVPGEPVRAILSGVQNDVQSACTSVTGELVYHFELAEPKDVRLRAIALDEYGDPVVSLRDADCNEAADELTCRSGSGNELFARALPAGSYHVALSGTGPAEAELALDVSEASPQRAGEGCAEPAELKPGVTEYAELSERTDAVQNGCLIGAPDQTYALELEKRSDVLLVSTGSEDATGAVLLAELPCEREEDALACASSGTGAPLRTVAHGVGPGSLRAVVETAFGMPASVTAFTRPAGNPLFVHRGDVCEDAVVIPPEGGRFEGTTANAYADYDTSCDFGGQDAGGAPDQLLRLVLPERRRMVFDMQMSMYDTMLVLRDGASCPGREVAGTCSPGYVTGRSFLDAVLPAGAYWVQIDGYDGERGRWILEVFSADP
jgi:hypothetical protein